MAKRPTNQRQRHSWAVYHIKSTPAKLVGIIDNAPDEPTAIARAIAGERQVDGAEAGLVREQATLHVVVI